MLRVLSMLLKVQHDEGALLLNTVSFACSGSRRQS